MPLRKSSLRTPALLGARRGTRSRFYRGAAREARRLGTKPECALESVTKEAWYTSLSRIRIGDRGRRIGLVLWVQRHRYRTLEGALRLVRGEEPWASAPEGHRLEQRWRRRRFRLRELSFGTRKLCKARSSFVFLASFFQAPVPEPHISTVHTCWLPIGRELRNGVVWLRPEAALRTYSAYFSQLCTVTS